MSSNFMNEDLRTIKTKKALYAAMSSLLKSNSFKKMTIKGICEEALISRAAFYAHFLDKYDLLKHWITELWPKVYNINNTNSPIDTNITNDTNDNYERIEMVINCHMHEHTLILKNLVDDADDETFSILFDFILSTIDLTIEKNNHGEMYAKNIVLANFYAGGIISYFLWQIKNKFPADVPPMNRYIYEMVHELQSWQS